MAESFELEATDELSAVLGLPSDRNCVAGENIEEEAAPVESCECDLRTSRDSVLGRQAVAASFPVKDISIEASGDMSRGDARALSLAQQLL